MPRATGTKKPAARSLSDWMAVSNAILAAAEAKPMAGPIGGLVIRPQIVMTPEMIKTIDQLYELAHSGQIASAAAAPAAPAAPKRKPGRPPGSKNKAKKPAAAAKPAAAPKKPAAAPVAPRKPAKRAPRAAYGRNRQVVRQAVDQIFASGKVQATRQDIITETKKIDARMNGSQVAVALTHWTAGPKPYLVRPAAGVYRLA